MYKKLNLDRFAKSRCGNWGGQIRYTLQNISQKWTMPIRDWKAALNRFTIQFDDRMPEQ